MPRIIAYTYDADVHCPDCADAAYAAGWLVRSTAPKIGAQYASW